MTPATSAAGGVSIELPGFPVALWSVSRQWLEETRRELALAGLSGDAAAGRLGSELAELNARHSRALGGRGDRGVSEMWAAHEAGVTVMTVRYDASPAVEQTAAEMVAMIRDLDARCRSGSLLTLPIPSDAIRFMTWYYGELRSQAAGAPAQPWTGAATGTATGTETGSGTDR